MLFILEYRVTRPLSSWKEHRHLSCMSCLHCTILFSELEVHLLFQNVLISWSSFGCKSSNTHPHSHCQLMFVTWHSCLHHTFLRHLFMFWQTLRTFYKTLETVSCNSTSMWIFFPLKSRSVPTRKLGAVDMVTQRLTSLGADLHISSFMLYSLLLWSRSFPAVKEGWAVRDLFPLLLLYMGACQT